MPLYSELITDMLTARLQDEVLGEQVAVTGDVARAGRAASPADGVAEAEHPVHVVGEGRVHAARHVQVLADHVEHVDVVREGGLVVVGAHDVDDLLEPNGMAGQVLRVHRLALDEGHHGAHLGLEHV